MTGEQEVKTGDEQVIEPKTTEYVSKEQYEKLSAELNELKEEVVSPEYLEFLSTGKRTEAPTQNAPAPKADDFEKLSKKELVELIQRQTKDLVEGTIKNRDMEVQRSEQKRIAEEVKDFADKHTDFDVYRPIMYGLSLDPKFSRHSLNQLYDAAKGHIESLKKGDTDEDKKRKTVMSGERPGSASASFERKSAGKSAAELNAEAMAETKAKLGAIPVE